MTESRTFRLFRRAGRALYLSLRLLVIASTTLLALAVANVLVHTYLHVCPLHGSRFEERAIVPVVYGRPLGGELFDRAARGEIVLGGCVRGPLDGVCPYCHWPAAFRGDEPEDAQMGSDSIGASAARSSLTPSDAARSVRDGI